MTDVLEFSQVVGEPAWTFVDLIEESLGLVDVATTVLTGVNCLPEEGAVH